MLIAVLSTHNASAQTARSFIAEGNKLYADGEFARAIDAYDRALVDMPDASEPKFNKANSYYRLDDLGKATDLFKEVAAETKDMKLVTRAKYNLGNCYFQQGSKQRDSDLQKALDSMKTSITHWRSALDIEPENKKAARNIEVARLIIKDIIDQMNKQQDPNQPQDPNQAQQQQQQGKGRDQQQQQNMQQDPNQPQDPNQAQPQQDPNQPRDPNEQKQQQQNRQQEQKEQKETKAPDAAAQEILDKEQRQKEQRRILQRGGYQKVERDW
jgi:hypothetical protein